MGDTDWSVMFELEQGDGRKLRCSEYRVSWAYAGALAGLPSAESTMQRAARRVRELHGDHSPVHLLQPEPGAGERLPRVEITAVVESDPLAEDADYSALVVVWYQTQDAG